MINTKNEERQNQTTRLRVAHPSDPLTFVGYTNVPTDLYERLVEFHWAAGSPENMGMIPTSQVAITNVHRDVQYVIRLADLIETIRMPGKKRLILDCESTLSPEPLFGYDGPSLYQDLQRDVGWSTYTISGRRYKLDSADAVLLDRAGLDWKRLDEGICASLTEVAGVEIYVAIEAFFDAANGSSGAVGSSGGLACVGHGPLMTKAEWLEMGGTEEVWKEEDSSVE